MKFFFKPPARRRSQEEHTIKKACVEALSLDRYDVEIRRTSYSIPHIKATDYGSMSFGVGYAYAEDNLQMIVDMILTVRGERSRFLGGKGMVSVGGVQLTNLDSDFFFKFYFDGRELAAAYASERVLTVEMAEGYAAGLNFYLVRKGLNLLDTGYSDALSMCPVRAIDFYLLLAQKAVQPSGEGFVQAILAAQPPSGRPTDNMESTDTELPPLSANGEPIETGLGSNAFAFGRDLTETTCGILAANPHFPWQGHKRLYEMHLTIPGELDVMGAALPPFPVINIGFNKDIAWTHTVSSSQTFAIYELKLAHNSPLAYVIDGKVEELRSVDVIVDVKDEDGSVSVISRTFYVSRFGPIIVRPEVGCHWSRVRAFAFHDLALPKLSFVEQWLAINKARSVQELKQALARERGVPWLNTIATDKDGDVLYANFSTVPFVSTVKRWCCLPSWRGIIASLKLNIVVLNGSRSIAELHTDSKPTSGVFPEKKMPFLIRQDYVLNCNDSHWLANLKQMLNGYSRFIGRERITQGFRTRMAFKQINELTEQTGNKISFEDVKVMTLSTRNMAAELIIDDLVALCTDTMIVSLGDGRSIDIGPAYKILMRWNRRDDRDSKGAVLFREFWRKAKLIQHIWRTPFDAKAPTTTPRDLNTDNAKILEKLRVALAETVVQLTTLNLPLDVTLSEVQRYPTGDGPIGIPGGMGDAGVLNQVLFGELTEQGYDPSIIYGSSYTQVVSWDVTGPIADAILPFSQSSDRNSPHYADQMELFARSEWVHLPFMEADIAADPSLSYLHLTQKKRDKPSTA
jgi:acyl-homoserine-lactone acylase